MFLYRATLFHPPNEILPDNWLSCDVVYFIRVLFPKPGQPSLHHPEAAVHKCSSKQVFLDILQYSWGNNFVEVSFQKRCSGKELQLYQKESKAQVFSYEYSEIFKNTFFYRTPLVVALDHQIFQDSLERVCL